MHERSVANRIEIDAERVRQEPKKDFDAIGEVKSDRVEERAETGNN